MSFGKRVYIGIIRANFIYAFGFFGALLLWTLGMMEPPTTEEVLKVGGQWLVLVWLFGWVP